MSGFAIVDLLLGLVFIFFILSIISSAVVEIIMTKMGYRSKILTKWLLNIFDKEILQPDGKKTKLGMAIADHCLTTALATPGEATSFMDAKNFVSALIEKITFDPNQPDKPPVKNLDELLKAIETSKALNGTSLLSTELRRTIIMLGNEAKLLAPDEILTPNRDLPPNAKNAFQVFREKLEGWFDSSMDRIAGKLKKKYARPITFWVGLVVTVGLNADAVAISRYLYDHKEETKAFADGVERVATRVNAAKDTAAEARLQIAQEGLKEIAPAGLPLGWETELVQMKKDKGGWWSVVKRHGLGWLATVMAIMLGAPFWFDLINKISNIRGAGSKPPSTTDKQRDESKTS
jgi:hypothetical protein